MTRYHSPALSYQTCPVYKSDCMAPSDAGPKSTGRYVRYSGNRVQAGPLPYPIEGVAANTGGTGVTAISCEHGQTRQSVAIAGRAGGNPRFSPVLSVPGVTQCSGQPCFAQSGRHVHPQGDNTPAAAVMSRAPVPPCAPPRSERLQVSATAGIFLSSMRRGSGPIEVTTPVIRSRRWRTFPLSRRAFDRRPWPRWLSADSLSTLDGLLNAGQGSFFAANPQRVADATARLLTLSTLVWSTSVTRRGLETLRNLSNASFRKEGQRMKQ